MKIKRKLNITMLVSILAVVFCLSMLINTLMRIQDANSLEKRANKIVRSVFELTIVTNDYLIHKGARAEQQWQIKHRQLTALMRQPELSTIGYVRLFETMFQDHETIQTLFLNLLKLNRADEYKQNHIYEQLWDRLIGQITTTAQNIISIAFRLNVMAKHENLSAQKQGAIIIVSLMICLIAIIIINTLLLGRSIARPIINLQQDIKKIGRGNLDHVVPSDAKDEIGELALAFNDMTSNLKKVTASKDTLEAEISKRKRMEYELRKARDELEARVKERTAELAESQKMLENITMGITDRIMLIDTNLIIIWSNQHAAGVSGHDNQSIIGQYCYMATHHMDDPCFLVGIDCPINKVKQTGLPASITHRHEDPDRKEKFHEIVVYPVCDKDGAIVQYIHVSRDISERILLHEGIKESNERYRNLFNDALDMIHIIDKDGRIIDANPAELATMGYTREEYIGKHLDDIIHPSYQEKAATYFNRVLDGHNIDIYETALVTKAGNTVHVEVNAVPRKGDGQGVRAVLRNISERKTLEDQLMQAQKMEAVGTLAGGVAHDFNNMLGVILGHTEMMLDQMNSNDSDYANLEEVYKAACRSADLTRQLLAFARKQTIEPKVIDLNHTVDGMFKMLGRLIGEDIDLVWRPEKNIWPIKIDPAQLDQIMANLCINARDAIASVGKVTIETDNIVFDQAYCATHLGFKPGRYVKLVVSDNGCGMNKAILEKVFEPFFTTKEAGKGTGLGLSTVYGIIKQNKGFINVYSEPGRGTSFKIYFCKYEDDSAEVHLSKARDSHLGHGETILLVEDEQGLLTMAELLLRKLKYDVLTANSPDEAVEMVHNNSIKIDLLITDVVMPQMSGKDLAEQIKKLAPEIKVLFMSGYTANVIAHHGVLDQGVHFIQKPFSTSTLSFKIREVLREI